MSHRGGSPDFAAHVLLFVLFVSVYVSVCEWYVVSVVCG